MSLGTSVSGPSGPVGASACSMMAGESASCSMSCALARRIPEFQVVVVVPTAAASMHHVAVTVANAIFLLLFFLRFSRTATNVFLHNAADYNCRY